ncbi:MAG: PQQ-dependent sugar dehydrogenase [Caldilineaceae bacterium]|nr:PQQ-dependent sugar dehydrogenase [Caldilineaceae bacterium]
MKVVHSLLLALLAGLFFVAHAFAQVEPFDWQQNWAVEAGFALAIDTTGYQFPSAIAFVPNPGPNPKDPLYFVTEVRGTIKVVTNDRSIYTFAEDFMYVHPRQELPSGQGQVGLAGICLEPEHGYVFATFAYEDEHGTLRNNIMRFQAEPQTFSIKPASQLAFTDVFLPYESGLAHHIGPCQINNGLLYVSVGEAWQPQLTQNLDYMHGKLIRMTLDGKPVPDNPFYQDDDIQKARNYIWAYGLRNPFGLKIVDDRVFVADNGQNIDRFLEIHAGTNYKWNGSDKTIATNAAYVFVPSLAPVQMDYLSATGSFFPPDYTQTFYVGLSAFDADGSKTPGIMMLKYGLEENQMVDIPQYFVKYRGDEYQAVTGVAFGPDGLYFSPLMPNAAGETPILKATYDPAQGYPYTTVQVENGSALFIEKGCAGCHSVGDHWGYGGSAGPNLEEAALVERLQARLNTDTYLAVLAEIDKMDTEPYVSWTAAREELRATEGMDRIRLWVKDHIQEPRFDTMYSAMPNLGITEAEATILTNFLVNPNPPRQTPLTYLRGLMPTRLSGRHILFAYLAGVATVGAIVAGVYLFRKWADPQRRSHNTTTAVPHQM